MSYNAETGGLTATFSVAKYLLDWDGAPYFPAAMPRTSLSTSDLFGTT